MVSTRSKAGANKQADTGPSGPANITPDLAAILDGQAKMQQELADQKKRSVDEMEALRQENSHLKRKIEPIPLRRERQGRHLKLQGPWPSSPQKKKASTIPPVTPSPPPNKHPSPQPIPLISPPPYQSTPRPLSSPPPSTPPRYPTIYPPPYILLISHHPKTPTTSLQPTSPLTTTPPPFPPLSTIPSPTPTPTPQTQTSPPLHRLYCQHPPSHPVGTLYTRTLHW